MKLLAVYTTVASLEAAYPALEAAIRELHGHELPAIYAVAVDEAYEPDAEWVRAEVAP